MFLELWQESLDSLELRRGPQGASHVVSGKSGILLHCDRCLRFSLQLVQGNSASSILWVTFESVQGTQALCRRDGEISVFYWKRHRVSLKF